MTGAVPGQVVDDLGQPRQAHRGVGAHVDPQRAAPVLEQGLQIAQRLRLLEHSEAVRLARNGRIPGRLGGQLQETSVFGPPL